jgi:hypothetical protein
MTVANRNIIETYYKLIEGLDATAKLELVKGLSESLEKTENSRDTDFFMSFGSFPDDKSAEEIMDEIKYSRRFREKDIEF